MPIQNQCTPPATGTPSAKDAATQLTGRSETMAGLVREGKLKIVYAMHDVATGKLAWFG